MSDALNDYLLGNDLIVAIGEMDAVGALDEYLGASTPSYTDAATVLAVQRAILAHPSYGEDPQLSLEPYRDDGVWGTVTAKAVARFNEHYAGLVAAQAGPRITDGTLQALGIKRGGTTATEGPAKPKPKGPTAQAPPSAPVPGEVPPSGTSVAPSGNLGWKIAAGIGGAVGLGLVVAGIAGWSRSRAVPR